MTRTVSLRSDRYCAIALCHSGNRKIDGAFPDFPETASPPERRPAAPCCGTVGTDSGSGVWCRRRSRRSRRRCPGTGSTPAFGFALLVLGAGVGLGLGLRRLGQIRSWRGFHQLVCLFRGDGAHAGDQLHVLQGHWSQAGLEWDADWNRCSCCFHKRGIHLALLVAVVAGWSTTWPCLAAVHPLHLPAIAKKKKKQSCQNLKTAKTRSGINTGYKSVEITDSKFPTVAILNLHMRLIQWNALALEDYLLFFL